ncbi:unnamed protein product [Allacma fusca]|nr:unnamed protein product [Allacma fusca]
MKAIVQRVTRASVSVNGELISSIGKGLCVLVGICKSDTDRDIEYIVRKLLNLRLWSDGEGKRWMHSLSSQKLEILCVSQFTLYHVLKGNSPDFHQAMPSQDSKAFFDKFISQLKSAYSPELVKEGKFGHYMQVDIQGDGPVTIQLESPKTETANPSKKTSKIPAETGDTS